jgi:hypothetical protein
LLLALERMSFLEGQDKVGYRILKTTLELRPLYHRKDGRFQAHVLLCYLALLLVRITERETEETRNRIRPVMERCHLGEFSLKDGRILQRTELTGDQLIY